MNSTTAYEGLPILNSYVKHPFVQYTHQNVLSFCGILECPLHESSLSGSMAGYSMACLQYILQQYQWLYHILPRGYGSLGITAQLDFGMQSQYTLLSSPRSKLPMMLLHLGFIGAKQLLAVPFSPALEVLVPTLFWIQCFSCTLKFWPVVYFTS